MVLGLGAKRLVDLQWLLDFRTKMWVDLQWFVASSAQEVRPTQWFLGLTNYGDPTGAISAGRPELGVAVEHGSCSPSRRAVRPGLTQTVPNGSTRPEVSAVDPSDTWGRASGGRLGYGNTEATDDDEPISAAGDVPGRGSGRVDLGFRPYVCSAPHRRRPLLGVDLSKQPPSAAGDVPYDWQIGTVCRVRLFRPQCKIENY